MYCESYQTYKLRKLGVSNLAKRDKYLGKPYEGKPHVRFDEGSRETGWQHYCALVLLYERQAKLYYVYLDEMFQRW